MQLANAFGVKTKLVSRLIKSGKSIVVGGSVYIGINFLLGLSYAALLGWPLKEVLVAAGITTISSSAIVAKVFLTCGALQIRKRR